MMKKLLLAAMAAVATVFAPTANAQRNQVRWTEAQPPVSALKDGGIYLIYDHSKPDGVDSERRAMRYVYGTDTSRGSAAIFGNSTLTATEAGECDYNLYAWKAIQDGANWKFQNVGTGMYMEAITSEANPYFYVVTADATESNVGKWTLTYNSTEQGFKVKSTACNQYWDGDISNSVNKMVTWAATSDAGTHFYQFFEITEDIIGNYKVTVNWKKGDNVLCTSQAVYDRGATITAPANMATGSITVGDDAYVVDYELKEGVEPFKLVSARKRLLWGKFDNSGLSLIASNANSNSAYAQADWLIEVPQATAGQFKIFAPVKGKYLASVADSADPTALADTEAASGTFRLTRMDDGVTNAADKKYWVSEQIQNIEDSNNLNLRYLNSSAQTGPRAGGWRGVDIGSQWFMVYDLESYEANQPYWCISDEEQGNDLSGEISNAVRGAVETYDILKAGGKSDEYLADLLAAINKLYDLRLGKKGVSAAAYIQQLTDEVYKLDTNMRDFLAVKAMGDHVCAVADRLPSEIVNADAISAWHTASATKYAYTADDVAEITDAYNDLMSMMINDDAHVMFRHPTEDGRAYLSVSENGAWYGGTDREGARAFTLKAAANGGFYLYNEYGDKYLKYYNVSGAAQQAAATQADASRFIFDVGTVAGGVGIKCLDTEDEKEYIYIHTNGNHNVVRWSACDNSSWFVELCSDDRAASEFLQGAKDSRNFALLDAIVTTACEVTGFYSVESVGADVKATVEMPETTVQAKRDKAAAIYAMEPETDFILNMPASGKLYTIRCTDTANSRGNLQYAEGYETIATSERNGTAYDADDVNQLWAIYTDADNKLYLYNVGAKLFANIYYERTNLDYASGEAYCWRFSKVPTEITEFSTDGMAFDATEGHGFGIYAAEGKNTVPGCHAGMFIVNGIEEGPVPATAGFGEQDNGIGFWLTEAGTVSEELQAEMQAAFDAVDAEVAAAKVAYDAAAATAANDDVVGHYTTAGFAAYSAAGTAAAATSDNDTKHFHYIKGLGAERVAIEHGGVYSLRTSEGRHYAVIGGEQAYTEDAANEGENTHFWQANVVDDNGNVYFTHTYIETVIELEHNGATRFTPVIGAPGVVTLLPMAAEKPGMRKAEGYDETPLTFVITKAPEGAAAATTSIGEISADAAARAAVYDLHGRRLAAPAKGINIIGGRKVIVK